MYNIYLCIYLYINLYMYNTHIHLNLIPLNYDFDIKSQVLTIYGSVFSAGN